MRNLDSDGLVQPGVAEFFPSGLRLITGGIPTGRSRGARRLVGREWFCDIRRRRRRARLAPSPILQVGGGGGEPCRVLILANIYGSPPSVQECSTLDDSAEVLTMEDSFG